MNGACVPGVVLVKRTGNGLCTKNPGFNMPMVDNLPHRESLPSIGLRDFKPAPGAGISGGYRIVTR